MTATLAGLRMALVLALLPLQAWIDLELVLPLPGWTLNLPWVDALALLLLVLTPPEARKSGPPGGWAWWLFVAIAMLGLPGAAQPGEAAHQWLRRVLFMTLAYGLAVPHAVRALPSLRPLCGAALLFVALNAALSIGTSGLRIAAGDALWYAQVGGLTPNHKTLAVAMAGWLPCLWALRDHAPWPNAVRWVLLAAVVAIALSWSKTAAVGTLLALGWFLPQARPWTRRPWVALALLTAAVGLAVAAPFLLQSKSMLDAARSRHSLDLRAWTMLRAHPWVGAGVGSNTTWEMVTFPEYRVNGVDAHGVVQKIASETGLLGLLSYGVAAVHLLRTGWARAAGDPTLQGVFGTVVVLQFQLLLSTETFSPTHWAPLGVAWGLLLRGGHQERS